MTSLTKRLVLKGIRQDIEYEEESVHTSPAFAQNVTVSVDKKVKDSILHMMTMPVSALQPTALQNPVANPLCAFLRAPNTHIIK